MNGSRIRPGAYVAVAVIVAIALGTSACAGASSGQASSDEDTARSGVLKVGMAEPAETMNPALGNPPLYMYYGYDPVIHRRSDGTYEADLAASWSMSSDNKTITLTIRSGTTFSDGSALTAEAVANSLNYFLKVGDTTKCGPVGSVTASGDTVSITYKSAYPEADAEWSLSQDESFGLIIGPKGLANPASLATTSDGVGEYTLDSAKTVSGTKYVWQPNAAYFNQAAIRFDEVDVLPYASTSAEVAALTSRQIQFAQNLDIDSTQVASGAGFLNNIGASFWTALWLENSSGPLANEKVRQAIAYAIDRPAVATAVYGGAANVQGSVGVKNEGGDGATNGYSYNPTKAKSLLAEAGYGSGFTVTIADETHLDTGNLLAQTVAAQLKSVGITLTIAPQNGTYDEFRAAMASKKYDGVFFQQEASDVFYETGNILTTGDNPINAYGFSDSTVSSDYAAAGAATSAAALAAAENKLASDWNTLAYVVPITLVLSHQLTSSKLHGVATSFQTNDEDPVSPVTSENWYLAD